MFNFTVAERGKSLGMNKLQDNTLKLGVKSLSLSGNVVDRIFPTSDRLTNDADGRSRVRVGFQFDNYNQAIKVTNDPQGFVAVVYETGTLIVALPSAMKRSGMPVGDYKLVPGELNVFQLAR